MAESVALPPMIGPAKSAPKGPPGLRFMREDAVPALYTLTGITRDNLGAVLGGCTVDLFYATGDRQRYASTVSDANGAYTFMGGDNVSTFFIVSYKDGATPVGGTSLQTLKFA